MFSTLKQYAINEGSISNKISDRFYQIAYYELWLKRLWFMYYYERSYYRALEIIHEAIEVEREIDRCKWYLILKEINHE